MNEPFELYEVGGKIRDEILGLESHDVDYVAVPNKSLLDKYAEANDMFVILSDYLINQKFEIFLSTPSCFTIRARFPDGHKYKGTADFVMARKEIGYIEGTRFPIIAPGTLFDDLSRRDATLNALARGSDGNIIDFFNGLDDLKNNILRTPLDCKNTIEDDPLRIFRYFRFSITKGFMISDDLSMEMKSYDYNKGMFVVSSQRIRDEMFKCFKYSTINTLLLLNEYPKLRDYAFSKTDIWLKPTNEK